MNKEELIKILGLDENATDEQIMTAIKAGAQAVEELATERTKAEAAELERIANQAVGDNAPPDKSEDLLYGVIDALNQGDEKLNASENWADFSAAAKEKLVGKTAKIAVPVKNDATGVYEFKPLVVDGKEVVRPLTAEDVDTIGKACLFNSVNI